MRKTNGATRGQLIGQFLAESVLMSLIAALIALLLIRLLMPAFNQLAGEAIPLPSMLVPGVLGIAVIVGFLSGIYPAFFLSSFQPAVVLKANAAGTSKGQALRKLLVVVQFAIALVLIIGTVFVKQQHDHLQSVDLRLQQGAGDPHPGARTDVRCVHGCSAGVEEDQWRKGGELGERHHRQKAQHARVQLGHHGAGQVDLPAVPLRES